MLESNIDAVIIMQFRRVSLVIFGFVGLGRKAIENSLANFMGI